MSYSNSPSIHDLITRRGPSIRYGSTSSSSSMLATNSLKRPGTPKSRSHHSNSNNSNSNSSMRRSQSAMNMSTSGGVSDVPMPVPSSSANFSSSSIGGTTTNLLTSRTDTQLEDQYIKNLQQQVQFLEMELELQKKASEEAKEQLLHEARPLEDSMQELKLAFIQKEKRFENELKQYKDRIVELELSVSDKEAEIESLRDQLRKMKIEFDEQIMKVTYEYSGRIVGMEKQIRMLTEELDREKTIVQRDLSNRLNDYMKENMDLSSQIKAYKSSTDDLNNQVTNLQAEVQEWKTKSAQQQEKIVSMEQDKSDREALFNAERMYQDLKTEAAQLKITIKQLEFDKEQVQASRDKMEKHIQGMMGKQVEQESSLDSYRHKVTVVESQRDRLQKELAALQLQVESSKLSEKAFNLEKDQLKKRYNEADQRARQSEKDLSGVQLQYKSTTMDLEDLQRDYNLARKQIETLNKENEELIAQHRLVEDRLKQFMVRDEKRQTAYEELFDQTTKLKYENRKYRKQLKLSELLNSLLRSGELQTIMNTNMNVASKIGDLISTMKEDDAVDVTDAELARIDSELSQSTSSEAVPAVTSSRRKSIQDWLSERQNAEKK